MATSGESDYPWRETVKSISRGAFIVVEGLDRAGKTSQVKKLCDELYASGRNVKTLRFPDRTSPIGKMIDGYLQSKTEMDDHTVHLLFSANRWEKVAYIRDSIAAGYTIVCDRYYYSGMIYSASKENPTLSLSWARSPDVGLPRPDLVIFLDISPEEAEKRGGYGEEKYEKREMQQKVEELFLNLRYVKHHESEDMIVVDAGSDLESVGRAIWLKAKSTIEKVEEGVAEFQSGRLRNIKSWPDGILEAMAEVKKNASASKC